MKSSLLLIGSSLFITAIIANPAISLEQKQVEEKFELISEEVIQPCCDTTSKDADAERITKVKGVPQGKIVDDQTRKRLKEQAEVQTLPPGLMVPYVDAEKVKTAAPAILSRFNGLNFFHGPTFPPDTILAAGPNHIIEMANNGVRLSSKTNSGIQIATVEEHFNRPGKFLFDPKIFYDKISNRFFTAILEFDSSPQTSAIHLAISQSSNPTSLTEGWCRYRINAKARNTWADFPGFGMNENWLAITTNNFRFSDDFFSKSFIRVVNKAQLVNNANSCPALRSFTFSNAQAFTIQPAAHYSTNNLPGTPLFLVSTIFGVESHYELWRVRGPVAGRPSLSKVNVQGDNYSIPPNARHKGTGVMYDTSDNRMLQAVFRNGSIWATHATGCAFGSAPNESCIRVVQITPNESGGAVGFQGTFGGGQNRFFWMPGISINQRNDIVVVFQQSSPGLFLGTAFTGKRGTASNLEPFRVLRPGACNISDLDDGGRNRTGDYTGAHTDPVDDLTFWIAGEFSSRFQNRCEWNTAIARVRYN